MVGTSYIWFSSDFVHDKLQKMMLQAKQVLNLEPASELRFRGSLSIILSFIVMSEFRVACENIRFSSLFADKDVSRRWGRFPGGEERGETDVFAG